MRRVSWHVQVAILAAGFLVSGAAVARAEGSLNPMALLEKKALADFIQRPLFDPTRRLPPEIPPPPPPPAPMPAVVAEEPPPNLHLLGVIHGPHDMAVLRQDDNRTIILRTGEQVNGWTVTVQPPNSVSLKKEARENHFALFTGPAIATDPVGVAANPGRGGGVPVSGVHATNTLQLQ